MPEPTGLSVFIIDDNEATRAILRMIIQGETCHVIGEDSNGISGMAPAWRLRPDIVLLDIEMPGSNGLDVLTEIKKTLPNTAVLMVTGSNDEQPSSRLSSVGPAGLF